MKRRRRIFCEMAFSARHVCAFDFAVFPPGFSVTDGFQESVAEEGGFRAKLMNSGDRDLFSKAVTRFFRMRQKSAGGSNILKGKWMLGEKNRTARSCV